MSTTLHDHNISETISGTQDNYLDDRSDVKYTIPAGINDFTMLEAATFYAEHLGMAIHPLVSPEDDSEGCGKRPIHKGWRDHTRTAVTHEYLDRFFGPDTTYNLGCVVRPPLVYVDLDSKPDCGTSVRDWIETQPDLAEMPREHTAGGAHIPFVCRNIPDKILQCGKALTSQLNAKVSAELYVNGLNIVLSPSVHPSGHEYQWEVTGDIPEVTWADLCDLFGFNAKGSEKDARKPKDGKWWKQWKQDLRSLDLLAVMESLGHLGVCADADSSKWTVRCPWESEHGDGKKENIGSATVIFNKPDTLPAFRCLHAHCSERKVKDVLEWAETRQPGIIAQNCTLLNQIQTEEVNRADMPKIVLPTVGRSMSRFCQELTEALAPANDLFIFSGQIVEIVDDPEDIMDGCPGGTKLSRISPAALVTAIERSVEVGVWKKDEDGDKTFMPNSLRESQARLITESSQFKRGMRRINRILDVPMPMLANDQLIFPKSGYDERFRTWLSPHAPAIQVMELEQARRWLLEEMLGDPENGGFCLADNQAKTHMIARFITPLCRGLINWARAPLWIFVSNREGCGKDTGANVTHVAYTGHSVVIPPASKDNDDEMRKRITSALIAGSRFFHLANMKGHIRYASLEAATDNSGVLIDRLLGQNENVTLRNEMEYSISSNNATWEPDIERRCRVIRFHFKADDINGHRYRRPNILRWVCEHRSELLSAAFALVSEWVRQGQPSGPTCFTSFPEWGRVVGGIMTCCGFGDPCLPHQDDELVGDQSTRAMRDFFLLALDVFGDRTIHKDEFQKFVYENAGVHDLFDWIDFSDRRGQTTFGKRLGQFNNRELGGISLLIKRTSKNRASYRFRREYTPGPKEGGPGDVVGPLRVGDVPDEDRSKKSMTASLESGTRGEASPHLPTSPPAPTVFCTRRSDLDRVAEDLTGHPRIALDIETYGPGEMDGLNPWKGDIRLLTVCRPGGNIWMLDLRAIGYDLGPLNGVLQGAELLAHNAKFDLLWLRVKCGFRASNVHCTLTAARLLSAGTQPGNNLDQCLERHLGVEPGPDHSTSNWGSLVLTQPQLDYAARDVVYLHDLFQVMEQELMKLDLDAVYCLETFILIDTVEMESNGIPVSREVLEGIVESSRRSADAATAALRAALGIPALNPASPTQLLAALQKHGLRIESTNEETLKAADDGHLVPLVLSVREANKRASQAVALIKRIESDGRIHSSFNPTGTDTGRFSSSKPNLQSVERGIMRTAFRAEMGRRLVVADYSQIELRIAAEIAGETVMLDAYRRGDDLHRLTAATVLGGGVDNITDEDRRLAKAVNFGLLYGQSARSLVAYAANKYGVALTEDRAEAIHSAFFRRYRSLRRWHSDGWNKARGGIREARTRSGRRRVIADNDSEWKRFTTHVNTPVQGGCADCMKVAITLLAGRLPQDAMLVSTVHDELIVDCREEDAENVLEILKLAMKDAMDVLYPGLPVDVDGSVCMTWADK